MKHIELVNDTIQYVIKDYENSVANFEKSMKINPATAIVDHARKIIITRELYVAAKEISKVVKGEDVLENLQVMIDDSTDNLMNSPWDANSTNPMRNLENLVKTDALVAKIRLLKDILKTLKRK